MSSAVASSRIIGIDLARAFAMLGMVIAHYAWPDGSAGLLNGVATGVSGRAMPLFVLLGGVGVTILSSRSAHPDRALLIRAAILYPVGVVLQEVTTFIAIILQYYALLFVLAILFRRLGRKTLVALAVLFTVIGAWTYQVVGPQLDRFEGPLDLIENPPAALWSLLFNGSYPLFPMASFFLVGMVLGRLDLRSTRLQVWLAAGGTVVGVTTAWLANRFGEGRGFEFGTRPAGSEFSWTRLLDTTGHSEMPAWVLSATGTSVAVLGICLLVAPRMAGSVRPLVALGQLALSFYVFQAVLVRFTPHPETTPLAQEFVTALAIYLGFMAFATIWQLRFRTGPLEAALRVGSSPRRQRRPPVDR